MESGETWASELRLAKVASLSLRWLRGRGGVVLGIIVQGTILLKPSIDD